MRSTPTSHCPRSHCLYLTHVMKPNTLDSTRLYFSRTSCCLGSGLRGFPTLICPLTKLCILITSSNLKESLKFIKISETHCSSVLFLVQQHCSFCISARYFPRSPLKVAAVTPSQCHSRAGLLSCVSGIQMCSSPIFFILKKEEELGEKVPSSPKLLII